MSDKKQSKSKEQTLIRLLILLAPEIKSLLKGETKQ